MRTPNAAIAQAQCWWLCDLLLHSKPTFLSPVYLHPLISSVVQVDKVGLKMPFRTT